MLMPQAHEICRSLGIKLHGRRHKHMGFLNPKECYAPKTIYEVALRGEKLLKPDHIYDVLTLFLSSKQNSAQMWGFAIHGVSMWLIKNKVKSDEVGFIVGDFRHIGFPDVVESIRHHNPRNKSSCCCYDLDRLMEEVIERIRK